jgi:hypothetical protein
MAVNESLFIAMRSAPVAVLFPFFWVSSPTVYCRNPW